MRRVVFFVDYEWALGSIHYALCRHLHAYGIDAQVLPWHRVYNPLEIQELHSATDLWVTLPQGWDALKSYGIQDASNVVLVSHAAVDLHKIVNKIPAYEFDQFRNLGVVSNFLRDKAIELNIQRQMHVVPVGIETKRFQARPSKQLKTVGYGGVFLNRIDSKQPPPGQELEPRFTKRSYLAQEAAQAAGLEFKAASSYHTTHVAMPSYYGTVDCVIIPSLEEGAGLPALEAGAAGRLVIGTEVGHWKERIGNEGGKALPLDGTEFFKQATDLLLFYKDNPRVYQEDCWRACKHAESYDWKHCVRYWAELLQ
jgi:glycosyltransferase involved in cell wall biosynthesis